MAVAMQRAGLLAESESVPESEESGGLRRGVFRSLGRTAAWLGMSEHMARDAFRGLQLVVFRREKKTRGGDRSRFSVESGFCTCGLLWPRLVRLWLHRLWLHLLLSPPVLPAPLPPHLCGRLSGSV